MGQLPLQICEINNFDYSSESDQPLSYFFNLSNENNMCIDIKKTGTYLTKNKDLIDKILHSIKIDRSLLNKKILEPSCGNGLLLLGIILKAYNQYKDKHYIDTLINDVLYFNDINSIMISETIKNMKQLYLTLFKENYNGNFNSFVCDFTNKKHMNNIKFDYIVGNPPYISLYGRRDKKDNEKQRIEILKNYNQFPNDVKNGKINYVMLFIERAVELLKPNANLTYIIDVAFFETAYKYTRKYLLANTIIESLEYNIQGFDVASGQVIISVINKHNTENNIVKIVNSENQTENLIPQSSWNNNNDEYKFRLNINDNNLNKILEKLNIKSPKKLKDLYPNKNLRTCCMLLNMEKEFLYANKQINSYPYYQGSKSINNKYSIPEYNYFFQYNVEKQNYINDKLKIQLEKEGIKNKKRIGFGEEIIYKNPKVFIRQSAKEIIATFDENESCANNSLYVFSLRDNSITSKNFLMFLCGFFNSKIATFYSQKRNIIRYYKGKQPQIKISDLYGIPIPTNILLQKQITNLVKEIYKNRNVIIQNSNKIDKLLYQFYKFDASEISYIENSIKDFLLT